jgi:membrane protease YdiL (CAAX protease family)
VSPIPRWPAWTAPIALIAAFAATLMASLVLFVIVAATGGPTKHPPAWTDIVGTLIQDGALVISAVMFARLIRRPRPSDFGLRVTRLWPAVGWLLLTCVSFSLTLKVLQEVFNVDDSTSGAFDRLSQDKGTLAVAGLCLLVTVAAPIAEELFFRGYFFTALRNWKGAWVAAAITGVTFGAIHIPNYVDHFNAFAAIAVAGLMVFGAALCLLYWVTGSLYPCFAAHALNNSLAFGVLEKWEWWQVIVLMLGANMAIATIVLAVGRRWRGALAAT